MVKNSTSDLCTINGKICVGCCLRTDGKKGRITKDLNQSTKEWKASKDPQAFGSRTELYVLPSGLCPNLVKGKHVSCAVHPAIHGKDFRPSYPNCYKEYLCETAQTFNRWRDERKSAFKAFLKKQRVGWYKYGTHMDDGTWLKRFRKSASQK